MGAQALVMTSTPSPRRSASPCRRLSFGKLESAGLRHSTKDSPHVLLGVERHGAQRRGRAACHGGLLAPHAGLQRARARLHLVNLLCVDTCRVRHRRFFLTFVTQGEMMIASVFCAACAHHSTRNMPATRALRRAPARATFQLSSDDDNNATLAGVLPSTYKRSSAARRLRMWSTTRRYAYRALHHRASILSTQLGPHSWASKSGLGRLLTD